MTLAFKHSAGGFGNLDTLTWDEERGVGPISLHNAIEDETHTVWFAVNEEDHKFPEFSWLEVIKCFQATTALFLSELEAWVAIKSSWSKEDEQSEV